MRPQLFLIDSSETVGFPWALPVTSGFLLFFCNPSLSLSVLSHPSHAVHKQTDKRFSDLAALLDGGFPITQLTPGKLRLPPEAEM